MPAQGPSRHDDDDHDPGEQTRRRRVLLVDDNRSFRDAVYAALDTMGYAVVAAASGEEALAALDDSGEPFDLYIIDLRMPGLSGDKVANEVWGREEEARVLFVSAAPAEAVGPELRARPARFLHKPFRLARLQELCAELLSA